MRAGAGPGRLPTSAPVPHGRRPSQPQRCGALALGTRTAASVHSAATQACAKARSPSLRDHRSRSCHSALLQSRADHRSDSQAPTTRSAPPRTRRTKDGARACAKRCSTTDVTDMTRVRATSDHSRHRSSVWYRHRCEQCERRRNHEHNTLIASNTRKRATHSSPSAVTLDPLDGMKARTK